MKSRFSALSISRLSIGLVLLCTIVTFQACKQEKVVKRTTTLYAYEVNAAAESYSAGPLRYMEASYYENGQIISKTYYNNDQTVKGKEVYTHEDNDTLPESSIYYDGQGATQATYKFTNKDNHQVQRDGYDGISGALLRQERYQYDTAGNRVKKIIIDSENIKQRTFLFGHDAFGNETQMTILDYKDDEIASEEYEIALVDDKNRWINRWGYTKGDKYPKTFYKQMY